MSISVLNFFKRNNIILNLTIILPLIVCIWMILIYACVGVEQGTCLSYIAYMGRDGG